MILFLASTTQVFSAMKSISDQVETSSGTLEFEIHAFEGRHKDMHVVADILKSDASKKLIEYFDYIPRSKVHLFLDGFSQTANGYASPIPHNFIYLFDYSPTDKDSLSVNGNWLEILILHELTHIIQMDQTDGFMLGLRRIFGSIVKPGALVPRWFSEGVAVWAESKFTNQGRLRSENIKNNIYHKFLEAREGRFCNDLGCLDNPGKYPFGSYPYWAGGFFIEYLENQKSGTIKCIVENNARKIPFFLGGAFKFCTGENADTSFAKFKADFIKDYEKSISGGGKSIALFSQEERSNNYPFASTVVKNNELYYLYYQNQEQFLGKINLTSREKQSFALMDSIDFIDLINNEVYLKAYTGMDERGKRRIHKVVERNGEIEFQELFRNNKPYSFPVGDKETIDITYENFQWTLVKDDLKLGLEKGNWLGDAVVHKNELYFKILENGSNSNILVTWDRINNIIRKVDNLSLLNSNIIGTCGDKLLYISEENGKEVRLYDPVNRIISTSIFRDLVKIAQGIKKTVLFLKNSERDISCQELWQIGRKEKVKVLKHQLNEPWKDLMQKEPDFEFYPKLSHMLPQYWYLFYAQAGNLDFGLARTLLSDPRGLNNFDLGINFYPSNNLWAPQITYTWNPRYFYMGATFQEIYTQSTFDNAINFNRYQGAFMGKQFVGEAWAYNGQFEFYDADEDDFISRRDSDIYGFSQVIRYLKQRKFQTFDHFYIRNKVSHYRLKGEFESFWALEATAGLGFNLTYDLKFEMTGGYSRFFKDDLISGVAFGGGVSSNAVNNTFSYNDFRGLPFSDIFGNTIYSYGGSFYYALSRPFAGKGFSPIQFNEYGPVLGSDYIRGDRIIIDNTLKRNSYAHSVYGGARANVRAFYASDINVDFLTSYVQDSENDQTTYLLVIGALF